MPYPTIAELLAADERGDLSDAEFDDGLWRFMFDRGLLESPNSSSGCVQHYIASRYMEWEVGNGGFAQAAYNIPEWFAAAALGYEALGLTSAAARIREAQALIEAGAAMSFSRGPNATIQTVFAELAESELALLDEGLDEIGWWAIEPRLAYVRQHRAAFNRAA